MHSNSIEFFSIWFNLAYAFEFWEMFGCQFSHEFEVNYTEFPPGTAESVGTLSKHKVFADLDACNS